MQITTQLFQNLVEDSPVATIVVTGQEARVLIVNDAFCKLILYKPEELSDKSLYEVLGDRAKSYRSLIDEVRNSGLPRKIKEHAFESRRNGELMSGYLQISYQPYLEPNGSVTGVIIRCQDITEHVETKIGLERALEQIRLSKEAAQLGLFDFDLKRNILEWDSRCRILFGISHQEAVNYERDFVGGLHPEDRERITGVIRRAFDRKLCDGDYDVEYRTIGAEDERLRWVRAKGKVYFNEHDEPLRFIGSVLEITEQKELELRKNDFIGMVSHELKTPLTSMSGYLQSMLKKTAQDGQVLLHGFLEKAFNQSRKMNRMINGFLHLSRLESGKLRLELTTFDLSQLIRETAEELLMSQQYNYSIDECTEIMILADREKLDSVIVNLLSNAIKYSPRNSQVNIACQKTGKEIIVSIRDRGFGILPQDLPHIFDRFYRVESQHLRHISGFGIGLYLCAEFIHCHGGRIWAESRPGEGSVFRFSLPDTLLPQAP